MEEELLVKSHILSHISEGIGLIKVDDEKILFTDAKFDEIFGYKQGKLTGNDISILYAPINDKSTQNVHQKIINSLQEQGVWKGEIRCIKKSGTSVWCDANISLVNHSMHGEVALLIFRDITEQKVTEDNLILSRDRLKDFIHSATDGFILFDSDLKIIDINNKALKIIGEPRGKVIGEKLGDYVPHIIDTPTYNRYKKVIETGEEFTIKFNPLPNFSDKHIELKAFKIHSGLGIIMNDITERKTIEEKLNHSLSILSSTLESTADGILVVNTEGIWTCYNQKFLDIWDFPEHIKMAKNKEDALKYAMTKLKHPNDFIRRVEELYKNPKEKSIDTIELIDGRIFKRYSQPQLTGDKIVGRVWSFSDITEQVNIENELLESENRFKAFSEATFEAIFISDKGICIAQNQMAEKMFGYTEYEAIGKPATNWVVTEDRETVKKNIVKNYDKPYEVRALKKDGSTFYAEIRGKMMTYKDKKVRITAVRDITERIQVEKALKKSEKKYRNSSIELTKAQAIGKIGSWKWNILDNNVEWSDEMYNIFGISKDDFSGNLMDMIQETIHPDDRLKVQESISAFLKDNIMGPLEYRIISFKDQEKIVWAEAGELIEDEDGNPTILVGIIQDITERKQAEKELSKFNKKLRDLTLHMQESIENERMKIALDLHDDLGQKLTALNMDLSWLRKKIIETQPHLLDKMQEMSALLNQTMKDIQKIATELRPSVLDNLGLTSAIEWLLKEYKKKSEIEYKFIVSPEEAIIDQKLSVTIFRIIQEALTNVIRHANATLVKVSIIQKNKALKIIVEDNGKGIAKSDIDNNTAFGLMGIKERANVFNGNVKIIGEPNKGTKVRVVIPYE